MLNFSKNRFLTRKEILIMPNLDDLGEKYGFGWIPDYPDFRDYTRETKQVAELLARSKGTKIIGTPKVMDLALEGGPLGQSLDIRSGFSEVENQGGTWSCTAHAADS